MAIPHLSPVPFIQEPSLQEDVAALDQFKKKSSVKRSPSPLQNCLYAERRNSHSPIDRAQSPLVMPTQLDAAIAANAKKNGLVRSPSTLDQMDRPKSK